MTILHELVRQAADPHDHAGHAHGNEHGSEPYCTAASCLRNWKIVFAVLLFVEGVVFGYVTLFLRKFASITPKRFRLLLSLVNVFGGGVFLATGLLHIMPEALEFLSGEGHGSHEAPAARATGANDVHGSHDAHGSHDSHGPHAFPVGFTVATAAFVLFLLFDRIIFSRGHGHAHGHGHERSDEQKLEASELSNELEDGAADEISEGGKNGFGSPAFVTASITTLGIAAHSVFEGVALGSSNRWGSILNIFIAVGAHRWATAMSLGARFTYAELAPLPYTVLIVVFSLIAPIGIAIGLGVRNASDTAIGVVFAISAGMFLYVGAFETPSEEFVAHADRKKTKFAVYTAGAVTITIITVILNVTGTH